MSSKRQKDPVESVRNAAIGYAATVLGIACFLLALIVTVAVVRLVAGGSFAATTAAQTAVQATTTATTQTTALATATESRAA